MLKIRDRSASQQVKDEEEVAPVVRNLEYIWFWKSTWSMLNIALISLYDLMTTILNKHWSHLRTNSQFPLLDHRGGPVGPIVGGRHLARYIWSVSGIIVVWSPSLSALSLSLCLTSSPPKIKNISKAPPPREQSRLLARRRLWRRRLRAFILDFKIFKRFTEPYCVKLAFKY